MQIKERTTDFRDKLKPEVDQSKLAELDHMIKGTTSTKAASGLSLSTTARICYWTS